MSEQTPTLPEPPINPPDPSLQPVQPPVWMPPPPTAPAPPAPIWSRVAAFVVLIAVVAAAAGAGIGWSIAGVVSHRQVAQSTTSPEAPIQQVNPGAGASNGSLAGNSKIDAIVARLSPAIVDINTALGTGQAAGTGLLISSTGEILTNNHVVSGSTSITVTVQGRSQHYAAHVVGVNVSQDVAVIQIDTNISGLSTVTFANSSSVKVGDRVIAIGNALGRGGAPHATSGQVTALDQTITASSGGSSAETLNGMIQSDALIYEGDSGGALVNTSGQVIGMITAGQAQGFRSTSSDVGYAIASNTALDNANRIRAHEQGADFTYGQVGFLGVSVQSSTDGALVAGLQPGSPAAAAGITTGSVITNLGGQAVTSSATLGAAIRSHQPGDRVSVSWVNSSGDHSATVTLGGVNP